MFAPTECKPYGHCNLQLISSRRLTYSVSPSSLPSVGLCLSGFFLRLGTTCSTGGLPICSRATAFTASTALNRFGFFFFAMMHSIRDVTRIHLPHCALAFLQPTLIV